MNRVVCALRIWDQALEQIDSLCPEAYTAAETALGEVFAADRSRVCTDCTNYRQKSGECGAPVPSWARGSKFVDVQAAESCEMFDSIPTTSMRGLKLVGCIALHFALLAESQEAKIHRLEALLDSDGRDGP